jgi:hypothetical protein
MTYEAWRISYQSSEQAAQAAYEALQKAKADRVDLIKELVPCQNVLHQLARSGQCTPQYADDACAVLERVTGGNPPTFDDHRGQEAIQ